MPQDMNANEQKAANGQLTPEQEAEVKAIYDKMLHSGLPGAENVAERTAATHRNSLLEKNALTTVDNKNYQYGGEADGANKAAERYRQWAEAAQGRQGEQIDYSRANQFMALTGQRAAGIGLVSTMQADRQMGQAAAEQSSAAASARGPAAMALAQQQAAGNTAQMAGMISGQAQINGAQEKLGAEQAAYGAYAGQAQSQAQINAAQRAQNDQAMLGMTGFETGVRGTQLGADMGFQGQKNSSNLAYAQLEAQRKAAKDAGDKASTGQMLQTGAAVAGTAAMMSDVTAKQNIAPLGGGLGGSSAMGSMFAPPGQQPMGLGGAGSYLGGGMGGATGASMTSSMPQYQAPQPQGINWNGIGQGLMGVSRSFAPMAQGYGGMGSMMSDERAKTNAFQMGTAAGLSMAGADPRAAAWDEGHKQALEDMQKLSRKSPEELRQYGDHPLAAAVRGLKADAWDEGRNSHSAPRHDPLMAQAREMQGQGQSMHDARMGLGAAVHDPTTEQFASGLAPSAYDYKPGFGTPGTKVGPMAQNMAANPVTATAVRQDPNTGLMSIDRDDGLKVALAAGGHAAQRVDEVDQRLARLELNRPSVGEDYLAFMRKGDRR